MSRATQVTSDAEERGRTPNPPGLLLVLSLDLGSKVLPARYEDIVAEYAAEDPQPVPEAVLHRKNAADPQLLVQSEVWRELAAGRDSGVAAVSLAALRSLRGTLASRWCPS